MTLTTTLVWEKTTKLYEETQNWLSTSIIKLNKYRVTSSLNWLTLATVFVKKKH